MAPTPYGGKGHRRTPPSVPCRGHLPLKGGEGCKWRCPRSCHSGRVAAGLAGATSLCPLSGHPPQGGRRVRVAPLTHPSFRLRPAPGRCQTSGRDEREGCGSERHGVSAFSPRPQALNSRLRAVPGRRPVLRLPPRASIARPGPIRCQRGGSGLAAAAWRIVPQVPKGSFARRKRREPSHLPGCQRIPLGGENDSRARGTSSDTGGTEE